MGCTSSKHTNNDASAEGHGPQTPAANPSDVELKPRTPQGPPSQPTRIAPHNASAHPTTGGPSSFAANKTEGPQAEAAQKRGKSNLESTLRTGQSPTSRPAGSKIPTTEALIEKLPQFRILVIGKTGVGKTTLINKTFDVKDTGRAATLKRGISDINEELTSESNSRFILHDSMGFEPGEMGHFGKVKAFIDERRKMPELKDKLHAIWLCVSTPTSGGRIFETGDEDFLKLDLESDGLTIPVIIVFTKYDILYSEIERLIDSDDDEVINAEAEKKFESVCGHRLREIMKNINPPHPHAKVSTRHPRTLQNLVQITQTEIETKGLGAKNEKPISRSTSLDLFRPVEAVKLAWAMAQRVNTNLKIAASIQIGKQEHWRGIEQTPGFNLKTHIAAIHADIISVWNFNDPDSLLTKVAFKDQIFSGIKDLYEPESQEGNAIAITHGLMGYIVDLTIIMHQFAKIGLVTEEALEEASHAYYNDIGKKVHQDIKDYIPALPALEGRDPTLEEVIKLINSYCFPSGEITSGNS